MKCPECQMTYADDSPEDRRFHRSHHDEIVNGVPSRPLKSDHIIWQRDENCIIVVNAYSPRPQRIRAAKVGRAANQEMQYNFDLYNEDERPDNREIHLFCIDLVTEWRACRYSKSAPVFVITLGKRLTDGYKRDWKNEKQFGLSLSLGFTGDTGVAALQGSFLWRQRATSALESMTSAFTRRLVTTEKHLCDPFSAKAF